ncbi:hypothetical protein BKA70DRAFT_1561718 [Coprinopsis sp. MPI-PUGE-AT-0042]|nr:hypothetical protein BKA70DRAFT_1561718 [Coprinopsis sp. MPI-PUGE-AT-0042]
MIPWTSPLRQTTDGDDLVPIPNEIYIRIFGIVCSPSIGTCAAMISAHDKRTLHNFAAVCQFFYSLAAPRVFDALEFDLSMSARRAILLEEFCREAMISRGRAQVLAQYIRHLKLGFLDATRSSVTKASLRTTYSSLRCTEKLISLEIKASTLNAAFLESLSTLKHLRTLKLIGCSFERDFSQGFIQHRIQGLKLTSVHLEGGAPAKPTWQDTAMNAFAASLDYSAVVCLATAFSGTLQSLRAGLPEECLPLEDLTLYNRSGWGLTEDLLALLPNLRHIRTAQLQAGEAQRLPGLQLSSTVVPRLVSVSYPASKIRSFIRGRDVSSVTIADSRNEGEAPTHPRHLLQSLSLGRTPVRKLTILHRRDLNHNVLYDLPETWEDLPPVVYVDITAPDVEELKDEFLANFQKQREAICQWAYRSPRLRKVVIEGMPELRLRTAARAALALRRDNPSASSRKFQEASFIPSARDVQVQGGAFNVVGGDVQHHYAPSEQQPTLADVLRALPNVSTIQADVLSRATKGTGQGLLKSNNYQTWTNPTGNLKTLWGRGKAGAGKSIQTSIVIDDLEARAKASDGQICVAYVYLRYTEAAETTVRTVLQALVKQIVERHPPCLALAEEMYGQHLREDTEPNEAELLELLAQFSRIFPTNFYILEALDEAPPGIHLPLVKSLSSLNVKLFITSRPLPAVEASVGDAEIIPIVPQDHDLDLLVDKAIADCSDLQGILHRAGPYLKEDILTSVKSKCDGMFLHAFLQMDAIQQCLSIRDVKQTLQNFPSQIEDAYVQTFNRISHQSSRHVVIAKNALMWVLNTPRPMTVAELQHTVATHPETFRFEQDRVVPETSLIPLCCGLIAVDDQSRLVRLVHYTAKPALEKVLFESIPHPHAIPATVCMTHLTRCSFPTSSISSKEALQAALDADPLLKYTHKALAFHTLQSLGDAPVVERVKRFIESCQSYPMFVPAKGFDTFGPLHVAIAYKLPLSLVEASKVENPNLLSVTRKISPLALASLVGNSSAMEHLLVLPDTRVNCADVDGLTELHYICDNGLEEVLEVFLRRPSLDINAKDKHGWTALMRACYGGHEGCVKLLLAYPGIQLNLVDNAGWSALMHAASGGHEGPTKLLLAHPEVDVNHMSHGASGAPEINALLIACLAGKEDTTKLLLADPRTDPHAKNQAGFFPLLFIATAQVHEPGFGNTTALIAAAENGHSEIVKILLALPGANINAVDDDNDTAIKRAAEFGDEETVRLLLAVPGVDINIKSKKDGHTASSVALEKGHGPVVDLLRAFEGV